MRILVVEDARRLAGIIRRGLQEDAYTVDNAYDGEEAQYMAETTPFDLIILDIMLPKKDGLTVCPKLQVGDLTMDVQTREVWRGQRKIELTAKEYAILEYFMRRPNIVVTRTMLGENVWDYEYDGISNIIDVYVRRLRQKIDEDGQGSLIQTLRGAGYRLRAI